MKTKYYAVLYLDADSSNLCSRSVEAYGTLPVGRWAEEHITPIAAPDQPVHIIEVPMMGHMIMNTQQWMPTSEPIEKVGC